MTEQEMEVQEVEVVETTDTDLELDEGKKASMGDPSEIPDPEAKDAKSPGGDGKMIDKTNPAQGSSKIKVPSTKVGMIAAMNDKMKKMKKDDVKKLYASYNEDVEVEETEEVSSIREIQQITSSDINVSEDIEAIFGGQDLSEEFVEKASTIFEAAVVSKVNEILETVTVDLEAELEVEKEEIVESLSAKLDDYLEYVAEEWMKENELAVEQGIKSEIVENFMVGLRNLFTENYIDIPEEKVDLVDELATKVAELEESAQTDLDQKIEMRKQVMELQKELVTRDVCEGLTESQVVKIKSLAEGVDFESNEDLKEKLETIKETYFGNTEVISEDTSFDDQEPVELDEEVQPSVHPGMRSYMDAISRTVKK
jgi:hypothetical protein